MKSIPKEQSDRIKALIKKGIKYNLMNNYITYEEILDEIKENIWICAIDSIELSIIRRLLIKNIELLEEGNDKYSNEIINIKAIIMDIQGVLPDFLEIEVNKISHH